MSDGQSSSEAHRHTRRRFLKTAGGAGVAGALGLAGWTGRVLYLHGENERTSIETADPVQSSSTGPSEADVPAERLLTVLDRYSADRSNVGLQACAIFEDGTRWCGVAGTADHDDEVPLSFAHQLYVGSVTKLYTATLVLGQVQQGALGLSDTIDEWVDIDGASEVTVEMVLNHTSGVPNYTSDVWFLARYLGFPTRTWDPSELLDVIRGSELRFEPGARHEYSNSNYVLLGMILERVIGQPYETQIRRLVREEFGFDRTYYLDYPRDARIANAYDESIFNLGRRNLTGFRDSLETGAYAAGGILSTAPDVAGFVRALFSGDVLSERMIAEMQTFVDAPDTDVPAQRGYGLGVRNLVIDGQELVGHTGTIPGYSAIAMHHDDPEYTIAVLSNLSTIDQTFVFDHLQRVVLEEFY
ncbi:serine hydrolase domain-containing protein [Haloarcula salina]|uniref:serine hydrolase domain-containing protein n=1 Tax=Haloarcula salina TaxID=1429914 RepID=UPI003C6F71E8